MPTISLRLTEEEHDALREWARGSQRSIQREVIFRLFSETSREDQFVPEVQTAVLAPAEVFVRGPMFPGGKSKGNSDFVEKKR